MHIFAALLVLALAAWIVSRLPDGFNYVIVSCCIFGPLGAVAMGLKASVENPHMDLQLVIMAACIIASLFGLFAATVRYLCR